MNIIIDASSVINMNNAGVLGAVCDLPRAAFWLTPLVVGECQPTCAAQILALKTKAKVRFIDDSQIDSELFLKLLAQHKLGAGETESIVACSVLGYNFCCDDRRARELGTRVLGTNRVTGTARVLQWCVEDSVLPCSEAFALFDRMLEAGGFLPIQTRKFFCATTTGC